ncbi:hypothetical protein MW887_008396 [Aspergillus wentii]|nr:hypothetical protein MW887_008396 [Aspergillus wentii]
MPAIESLELVLNKGPLLTTALALFGPNSWIDLVNRYSDLYEHREIPGANSSFLCGDVAPLGRILAFNTIGSIAGDLYSTDINICVHPQAPDGKKWWVSVLRAGSWLSNFRTANVAGPAGSDAVAAGNQYFANAFTVAAYLANMAWISEGFPNRNSLTVEYDMGADSQKPSISLTGIIVVSILIGLDLLGLLATAVYASWFPRWTGSLDAFSLLRLGSSISQSVPLKVSVDDEVRVLDELPGWVGDDAQDEEIGRIAFGGSRRLRTKMQYESYGERKR